MATRKTSNTSETTGATGATGAAETTETTETTEYTDTTETTETMTGTTETDTSYTPTPTYTSRPIQTDYVIMHISGNRVVMRPATQGFDGTYTSPSHIEFTLGGQYLSEYERAGVGATVRAVFLLSTTSETTSTTD